MAIDTAAPRTRRTILASALGGLAAWVASGLGRPEAVSAHDPDDVELGNTNTANHGTIIECLVEGGAALAGHSADGTGVAGTTDGSINNNYGVSGYASAITGDASGVWGESASPSGTGVYGYASATTGAANGVYGQSDTPDGTGVWGTGGKYGVWGMPGIATATPGGSTPAGVGVFGYGGPSTGVLGYSGSIDMGAPPPDAKPKTGVFGYAAQDATSRGVTGQSTAGYGVYGTATTGRGLFASATTGTGAYGYTTSGIGARGYAATGTGGYFSTSGAKIGTALQTVGKVKFDKSVGVATVAAGAKSVTVTPGIDLTATSAVVATLQGTPIVGVAVISVAVDATADTFTIYLTANATAAVKAAWHVFG